MFGFADFRATSSLNQLLDAATNDTGIQQTAGGDRTAAENNIHSSISRGSEEIGSLQSLMERSESFLGQMEGRSTGSGGGGGSLGHHGEGSPAPRPSPAVERSMTSPDGESDDSDISIVGETPGNGSSALDSLGNFSLNSLLGGGGGSIDIGGSDSPLGRGSPHHHHRGSASSSSSSTSASSSHRAYPPSASFGSMASMAHHMMTSPYMTPPGWGFPVWNPAGMSVPMPPSGPSIQHSDHSSHHGTQHSRSQHHHSSSSSSNRDGSKNDTLSLSDNSTRTKHAEDQLRESDSPGRGSRGSPSMHHSLPSATSTGMPPFMGLPYGMPYSYPPYSYPYLPPGIPPAHSHGSSDASSAMRGGYYPPLPPYPGSSFPGAAHLAPSSGGGWSGLSSNTGNPVDDNKGNSND